MSKKYASILLCLLLFISCAETDRKDDKYIYHPTDDNFLNQDEIGTTVYTNNAKNNSRINEAGKNFLKRYSNKTLLTQIGVLEEKINQLFSSIDQVVIDSGRVIIFDRNNVKISIFSLGGDHILSAGQQGRGPGELAQPNGITVQNHDIFVSERLYSITKMDFENDSSYSINNFLSNLKGYPTSICSSGNSLIIRGLIKNKNGKSDQFNILHEFNISTKHKVGSFGEPYHTKNAIVKEVLSEGIFACYANAMGVVNTLYALPYIYSYDSDNNLDWITKIDEYAPLKFREQRGAGMTTRWEKQYSRYDEFRTLLPFNDLILLQIETFENNYSSGGLEINSLGLTSYLINRKSGTGTYLGKNIPKIYYFNKEYIVTDNGKKFPGIKIYMF